MLKYSGDLDSCIPTSGTLGWINTLNWKTVSPWRSYSVSGQVAGWIWELDGLTFASVHGAGHQVPMDQPERAEYLVFNWLRGDPI